MKLGHNEFWAVVFDCHDGRKHVVSTGDGSPYMYGTKKEAAISRRYLPSCDTPPKMYVARVRVEVVG